MDSSTLGSVLPVTSMYNMNFAPVDIEATNLFTPIITDVTVKRGNVFEGHEV